jgi:lysophospholipase L1-like esterase
LARRLTRLLVVAVLAASVLSAVRGASASGLVTAPEGAPFGIQGGYPGGDGGVLVVGDSLEVLTSPYLRRYLPGIQLEVNAEGGYNSYQIYDLFKESYDPSQSVIVFDAGTNDNPAYPQILAGNLEKVAATVGSRCMVVPTIHGFTVNGVNNAGKNRVVRQFAAARPGTRVPDWARVVATHPEMMQPDDLHPNPAGADKRARIIASAVKACLTPSPTVSAAGAKPAKKQPSAAELPQPVSGGHFAAAEVRRRVSTVVRSLVQPLLAP